tara:strand:- start:8898 stop:9659 length:762 start_codon:yes stop_codon:yes gene_type:complete
MDNSEFIGFSKYQLILEKYKMLCEKHNIDESHGPDHVVSVFNHINNAIESYIVELPNDTIYSLRIAALLHDADDRKYFTNNNYENANKIMKEVDVSENVRKLTIKIISYVSCSKNGDNIPEDCLEHPEYLWVRWSDRIEASGKKGIIRCWQYNTHKDLPIACSTTPMPITRDEVLEYASKKRFDTYFGKSNSMLDHYYDKLIYISKKPKSIIVKNEYLQSQYNTLIDPLIELCIIYSKNGENGVIKHIHSITS